MCIYIYIYIQTHHNLDHAKIVDLFTTGFSRTLHGYWEKYLTKESRKSIKKAVKKDENGLPIFNERVGQGISDGVNILIYTIIKHFVRTIYIYIQFFLQTTNFTIS